MLNINLEPEYVINILGLNITNSFLTSIIVTIFLTFFAVLFYLLKNKKTFYTLFIKILIRKVYKFINSIVEDANLTEKILPLITTFFIFILSANLFALIPGFLGSINITTSSTTLPLLKSPNSDLTITLALAIISVFSIQFFSIKNLGFKIFIKRFINFSSPVKFILGFFELISESSKILSFSFRLFGNVFAGEVLLLVMAFLMPYFIPLPFMLLEIFVGFIQSLIFAILSITFIKIGILNNE